MDTTYTYYYYVWFAKNERETILDVDPFAINSLRLQKCLIVL